MLEKVRKFLVALKLIAPSEQINTLGNILHNHVVQRNKIIADFPVE